MVVECAPSFGPDRFLVEAGFLGKEITQLVKIVDDAGHPVVLRQLRLRREKSVQARRLKIPIHHQDSLRCSGEALRQQARDIGHGHGTASAAFVGIESNDLAARGRNWRRLRNRAHVSSRWEMTEVAPRIAETQTAVFGRFHTPLASGCAKALRQSAQCWLRFAESWRETRSGYSSAALTG